jgi:hypothetical protein
MQPDRSITSKDCAAMRYQTVAAGETTVAAKGRGTTKNKREKAMTSYNEDSELQ